MFQENLVKPDSSLNGPFQSVGCSQPALAGNKPHKHSVRTRRVSARLCPSPPQAGTRRTGTAVPSWWKRCCLERTALPLPGPGMLGDLSSGDRRAAHAGTSERERGEEDERRTDAPPHCPLHRFISKHLGARRLQTLVTSLEQVTKLATPSRISYRLCCLVPP